MVTSAPQSRSLLTNINLDGPVTSVKVLTIISTDSVACSTYEDGVTARMAPGICKSHYRVFNLYRAYILFCFSFAYLPPVLSTFSEAYYTLLRDSMGTVVGTTVTHLFEHLWIQSAHSETR